MDMNDWQQLNEFKQQSLQSLGTLELLNSSCFELQTPSEARELAVLLATLCPEPERVVLGLSELLLNAIEHGNLAIGYNQKSELLKQHKLDYEIARRLQSSNFKDKLVTVRVECSREILTFIIEDEGQGFDWKRYQNVDPQRLNDHHGRGIAMASLLSFDAIQYEAPGNRVRAVLYLPMSKLKVQNKTKKTTAILSIPVLLQDAGSYLRKRYAMTRYMDAKVAFRLERFCAEKLGAL